MPTKFIRKRNRLPFKEMYQGGYWYFITICVQDRKCIFVEESPSFPDSCFPKTQSKDISNPEPNQNFVLNQNGQIVKQEWLANLNFYKNIILDEFVIMPNHFHAIIGFDHQVIQKNTNKTANLGQAISRFKNDARRNVISVYESKSGETGSPLRIDGFNPYKFWQKSFYDHIIRDEKDLDRVREYIINNPLNWHLDSLNPVNFEKNSI